MNTGGAFVRETKRAKLKQVEGTDNHPDGNKARSAQKPIKQAVKKAAKKPTATKGANS